ncbi:EAL and HDOD domain-containing protein [Glaciecola sp. KUL10]|uniref:EAL and HDOD domain-containing protein n=1 Tax=Glaciecola sp. (strain KUL10) TaxID=2161813 RepID=UPI000D78ABCA|nr:EAL domain-containing protein [Glaciecola sp. KUL10]GBL03830.1 EAL domain-containing protein [Glaciecola sp. KUL10]
MFAYIARQAIYDLEKQVYAYELLFRDGVSNCFPDISPDEATSNMIANSHLTMGVEDITLNKHAFINFHQNTLLYRFPSTLDPLNVVVEIVETVEVDSELLKACEHIRNLGYRIALDDYDFAPRWEPLIELCNFIKIEAELIENANLKQLKKIRELKDKGIKLVAEKVETLEQFQKYKTMGFDLFQGYFLARPEVVKHKSLDAALTSIIELVGISTSPDFDINKVNDVIEKDVGLSFKLMRFINNPTFNKRNKIESLSHALKYMGSVELKKFIALLALANLKGEKPEDLITLSLIRAKFCALMSLAANQKDNPPNSFILGLFSYLDALLDQPMESLMPKLPVSDVIKDALLNPKSVSKLANQLRLCRAFELADWENIEKLSTTIELDTEELYEMHYTAMKWTNDVKNSF